MAGQPLAALLRRLGYRTYDAYLRGKEWAAFRKTFLAAVESRGQAPGCVVCGRGRGLSLHHVDYSRLGREEAADVVALCPGHHAAVHAWLDGRGLPVTRTLDALVDLLGRDARSRRGRRAEGAPMSRKRGRGGR